MPFLLAEILNFQGSTHRIGVGSFSLIIEILFKKVNSIEKNNFRRYAPLFGENVQKLKKPMFIY